MLHSNAKDNEKFYVSVIPAEAGIQALDVWIPTFVGMTIRRGFSGETVLAEDNKNALLIAPDRIGSPGERIFIKVKLMAKSAFFPKPISGERIEFIVDGNPIGVSLTGGDGVAVREFIPKREGIYKINLRLAGRSGYSADEAYMIVACWKRTISIVLIDINTLSSEGFKKPDPAPDAKEVLEKISKGYKIILYASDKDQGLSEMRRWLKDHAFPETPIFSWQQGKIYEEVNNLISRGWRLKFGIGSSMKDIRAFSEANITPIIFLRDKDEIEKDLPGSTKKAGNWKEIERVISGSSTDS
ncbi:MAG: hypothetical protein HZA13_00830 [Nitrospirae bacterium]|nr:hypothetical protein [Nitrospirota bacterium]